MVAVVDPLRRYNYYYYCIFISFFFVFHTPVAYAQSSGAFRDDIFPEQLLQQQLQFKQNTIHEQLQGLQQQFQENKGNQAVYSTLQEKQASLMIELQQIQKQMLELQQQIIDRLGGGHKYKTPTIKPPQTVPFVPQQQQPVTQSSGPVFVQQQFIPTFPLEEVVVPDIPQELDEVTQEKPCTTSFNEAGICRPLVRCLFFYTEIPELRNNPCPLIQGEIGVCCPLQVRLDENRGNRVKTGILVPPPEPNVVVPAFTMKQINNSINVALEKVEERKAIVSDLVTKRIMVESGSAAAWHQELFPTTNETLEIGEDAQKNVEASVELVNDFKLSPEQGKFGLPKLSILNTILADTCPKKAFCQAHKYRSTDGSCNNLKRQQWGAAGTALQRILPPKYGDGVNSPRTHADSGKPLPSSRLVSVTFAQERDSPSDNFTLLLMQWGQFVDHDLTHTPISRGQSGFGISCCRSGRFIDPTLRHPDCFAIEMASDDHMFARFNEHCMEFVRSLPAPRPECNFGPREQMNQITGYMDASSVYGSNLDVQRGLRLFSGGRLLAQNIQGRELLPPNPAECNDDLQNLACFRAGDGRVNEQVELAVMHTIWMREHNRIASELARLHPNWSDEALFQETRRIIIAQIQHITYNEFLPILIGQHYMDTFQLNPKDHGWTQIYDPELNPGITNAFATAAYRFGHTLIQDNIHGYGKFGNIRENLRLSKQHFAPFDLYREGGVDDFIRGLSFQSAQNYDRFFTKEITDHLFQGNLNFGLDLVALNLQRGRDHGIPPYNDWREVCGMKRARSWRDLEDTMDAESIDHLARVYDNVNEVDLFVAGVAERSLPGALLGPTFVCIIADQFARLKRGDRFFYEEAGQPSSFSEAQLNAIRKVSLARVLCDNSEVVLMQPLAFMKPTFLNQRVPCDSHAIPRVDLNAWAKEVSAVQ